MILPRDKEDINAILKQRDAINDAIGRMKDTEPPSQPAAEETSQALETGHMREQPQIRPEVAPAHTETHITPPPSVAEPEDTGPDPMAEDPPTWIVEQASLSELLLWRLGIPVDREAVEREHQARQSAIDLKPPITTRKVADAIANLSLQLMQGTLDATTAKTSLYALQTLLTALRLQIVEEKNARTKAKAQKTAKKGKKRANRKR